MIDNKYNQTSLKREIESSQISNEFPRNYNNSKVVPDISMDSADDGFRYPVKPPGPSSAKKPSNRLLQTYNKPSIYHPESSRNFQRKRIDPRRNKAPNSKTPRVKNERQKTDRLSSATLEYLNNPVLMPKTLGELQKVVRELESLREFHVKSQNYPEAEGIQRLIQSARKKIKFTISNPPEVESCVMKHKELQQVVQRILTQWNEQYDEFVETTQTEYKALMAKHEEEINKFDSNYPEQLTPQYRKRSVALLESRSKEKRLAFDNQLVAAKQLKAKNDEIESKEAMQQYERMQNDYLKRRERLISQQEEQVRVFLSHADSARTKMLQTRTNLLQGYLKRMEKLNTEIAEICETQNIDPDTLDYINLPLERVLKIENIEQEGSPIPTMRKQAFTSIRQKIRRRKKEMEEKKEEEEEEEKEEDENSKTFVTNLVDENEFKDEIEIENEEEEQNIDENIQQNIEEEVNDKIENDKIEEENKIENDKIEEEDKIENDKIEEEDKIENDKIVEEEDINENNNYNEENDTIVYGREDVADMTFFTSTIATFANEPHDDYGNLNHKKFMDPNEELERKNNDE